MKKILRAVASFLVCATMFSITSFAQVASIECVNPNSVEIIFEETTESEQIEVSSITDTYMYFHDTSEYTISILKYSNGQVEIAKNDKDAGVLSETVTSVDAIDDFETTPEGFLSIEEAVCAGLCEMQVTRDSEPEVGMTSVARSSVGSKIEEELEGIYGSEYGYTYRAGKTSQGYTGSLYERMYFSYSKYYSWVINAGSTLAAVASLLALPESVVLQIITFVGVAATGYSVYKDITANKYSTYVNYNKIVTVKGTNTINVDKTIFGYSYIGDRSAAFTYSSTSKQQYYDNNSKLLDLGIENYISYA